MEKEKEKETRRRGEEVWIHSRGGVEESARTHMRSSYATVKLSSVSNWEVGLPRYSKGLPLTPLCFHRGCGEGGGEGGERGGRDGHDRRSRSMNSGSLLESRHLSC